MARGARVTRTILSVLRELGPSSPSDVVVRAGLPRYLVLAAFQVLEELGLVRRIYDKGSHKVYVVSEEGAKLLEGSEKSASEPVALGAAEAATGET